MEIVYRRCADRLEMHFRRSLWTRAHRAIEGSTHLTHPRSLADLSHAGHYVGRDRNPGRESAQPCHTAVGAQAASDPRGDTEREHERHHNEVDREPTHRDGQSRSARSSGTGQPTPARPIAAPGLARTKIGRASRRGAIARARGPTRAKTRTTPTTMAGHEQPGAVTGCARPGLPGPPRERTGPRALLSAPGR
jgi:hypothetical protein